MTTSVDERARRASTAQALTLLTIGGSDAGMSAALRAREVEPAAEVTVFVADRFPSYSTRGRPTFVSGEVGDWRNLAIARSTRSERWATTG